MPDIYLGDKILANDGEYLVIDDASRFYLNGKDLELQQYESGAWVTYQTWTSAYDGVWRLHTAAGLVYLDERNGSSWVTSYHWGA